ncbi:polyprenyl synthetase [Streptomyces sp. NPDC101249]|uniref:polyprenyl synthetase n=1 Tax=Streptomyces sp. NPDC101249 TaxID=3366140 RepID=UPI00382E896B
MIRDVGRRGGEQAVLLAAGLADLAVDTVGSALGAARSLLRRSDTAELAAQAADELTARGRLVLDRYAVVPPAHLEVLARHVLATRSGTGPGEPSAPPAGRTARDHDGE